MTYPLENPPLRASVNDHAKSVTANAFRVSSRTIDRWGVEMKIVQGKRQPLSSEIWAAALARMPHEDHEFLYSQMREVLLLLELEFPDTDRRLNLIDFLLLQLP